MAKSNNEIVHPQSRMPHEWNLRDTYQEYAAYILKNDPQCWGKYNIPANRKNYWIYKTVNGKIVEVMNYKRWQKIIEAYFESAKRHVIYEGSIFSLGNLGRIAAKRCERNFEKPKINHHATRQQPRVMNGEGRMVAQHIIYYTDPEFLRIGWRKNHVLTNESVYVFLPTRGRKGFTTEFSKANTIDPSLRYKYEYFPRHVKKPQEQTEPV